MTSKQPFPVAILQMTVRIVGVALIILGILVWPGTRDGLIPVHTVLGVILVLALFGLAAQAARAGVNAKGVWLAVVWGLVTAALGVTQQNLLGGASHWVVQVLHLFLGLGAIGIAELLGANTTRAPAARVH